jgi:hypothetical protein
VASERQVGVNPLFKCHKAKFLQADDFVLRKWLERELSEGRPTPERERLAQLIGAL